MVNDIFYLFLLVLRGLWGFDLFLLVLRGPPIIMYGSAQNVSYLIWIIT